MNFILHALLLGTMSASATLITFSYHLPTWVLFIAWTSFVLFGKTIRTASTIFVQQILGILIAAVVISFGDYLAENFGPLFFHLSVFLILFAMYGITKLKKFNVIPAYFLGMIIWFGAHVPANVTEITTLVLVLLMGYCFAWVYHTVGQKIDQKFN